MTYLETEHARLNRSRAMLRETMRRRQREITEVRRRARELGERQARDAVKLGRIGAEIEGLL